MDERSGRPAYDVRGKLILPDLEELGVSQADLAAMAAQPVTFDQYFCLTGTFALGERGAVARQIEARGGIVVGKVKKTGCIVVLGTAASAGWTGESWGRKLEDAVEFIQQGLPVRIITEDALAQALTQVEPMEAETPAARRERYARLAASGDLTDEEADLLRVISQTDPKEFGRAYFNFRAGNAQELIKILGGGK
ncbi:MAG: BRCT domain-containing protein [Desulfovibrionaceae bacterium]|nr:BRCT domain-containing protein [Desulfovibrionaceae bacterium]